MQAFYVSGLKLIPPVRYHMPRPAMAFQPNTQVEMAEAVGHTASPISASSVNADDAASSLEKPMECAARDCAAEERAAGECTAGKL